MTDDAMAGLATGRKGNKREQTILTPSVIVYFLSDLWPMGIGLDPCGAEGSIVPARSTYYLSRGCDGLHLPWREQTYVNPPYDKLKLWLAKWEGETGERAMLCPVRPNRKWWRQAALRADAVAFLDPITFLGYDQAFPASLCLLYRGPSEVRFKRLVEQHELGDCTQVNA